MIIALNEVYFGKTPNLIKAEKLLASIKSEYDGNYYAAHTIELDKRWREMRTLLANEFGFKDIYIEIEADKTINACTYSIGLALECMTFCRPKKNLIIDRTGMKFKKDAGFILMMLTYTGLILNPNFSAGEIIAVLLHEIGHNFQAVIDDTMIYLSDVTFISRILAAIMMAIMKGNIGQAINLATLPITQSMAVRNIFIKIDESLNKIDAYNMLNAIFDNINGRLNNFSRNISYIATSVNGYMTIVNPAALIGRLIGGLIGVFANPLGYRAEKIADNFATIYGYGPELSSVLMKMEIDSAKSHEIQELLQNTFVGKLLTNGYGAMYIICGALDVHPQHVERALDQIRYLETELEKSSISKECKVTIRKQIKEIDDNLSTIMRNPKLDEHWDLFRYFYANLIYDQGGDMRRSFMGKDINKNIQKTYDKAIKSLK